MNSFYDEEELKTIGFKSVGSNVLISRKSSIYNPANISIGDNVRIDDFCVLSGKITIGDYVHIATACLLFGGHTGIIIEDYTGISSRSAIYAESDDYTGEAMTNPTIPYKFRMVTGGLVTLKKHSVIGTGCTILPNVTIGEGCSIGSMSLVIRDLEDWGIYIGIPCKRIRDRSKNLLLLEKKLKEEIS